MLSYAFPPVLVSGTARSVGFSQNLPSFGWDPTVLTVDQCRDTSVLSGETVPSGVRVVRTTELNLQGLLNFLHGSTRRVLRVVGVDVATNYYQDVVVPDAQIAWLSWISGIRLAKTHDLIYASCSPFSSAIAGCLLKKISGKPLVVDFRDPWSLNPYTSHGRFHMNRVRSQERWVLATCDRLIVNTEGTEALYKRAYPEFRDKIVWIPNGYDALIPVESVEPTGPFRIMHVGNFYGSRGPQLLIEALQEIGDPSIELVQLGLNSPILEKANGLNVQVITSVPREKALQLMTSASLLYLKQGFEKGITDYVSVAAKTYEYLATGLPVLADCPEGDNANLVRRYCAYPYVVTTGKKDDLKAAILQARKDRVAMVPRVTQEFKEKFDRVRLTEQLAQLFDSVVKKP